MRTAVKGHKCEARIWNQTRCDYDSCEERHLELGLSIKGPVSLIACVQDGKAVLLCQNHAKLFPAVGGVAKRRKKKAPQVEQLGMGF